MQEVQQDLLQVYERQAGCLLWLALECADKNVQRRLVAMAAEYIRDLIRLSDDKPIQPTSH